MSTSPFVSIIIPTFNRESLLLATMKGTLAQDYPSFEVIVVDQTSIHSHVIEQELQKLLDSDERLRYIHLANPSLPDARNKGIEVARGDIILFIDDDVILNCNLVASHVNVYCDHEVGGVAGRIIPPVQDRQPVVTTGSVGKIAANGMAIIGNFSASHSCEIERVRGANMSFRRHILTQVGGFDPAFSGTASYEEVDLSYRVRKHGYKLIFEPAALLVHLSEQTGGCETRADARRANFYLFRNSLLFVMKNMGWRNSLRNIAAMTRYAFYRFIHSKDPRVFVVLLTGWLSAIEVIARKVLRERTLYYGSKQ